MLKVIRKTLTGVSTEFKFDIKGLHFLVKNFANTDVLINFEPITDTNEANSIKLPAVCSQRAFTNLNAQATQRTDTIYVKGTGEVEVQVIWY